MASEDLLEHAKSETDFYDLLGEGIHPGSSDGDIRRAYRRTALKHHPDKNKDDPQAVDKFHALQIAFDVLSDPAAKAAYDNARLAREAKRRQREQFEGKRRTMIEELERREGAALKRKRGEDDAEAALEREIKRLAEDGRRRRMEREERLRKEMQQQEQEEIATLPAKEEIGENTSISDTQRTVKVRWRKEGAGESLDKDRISTLFARFGKIELAMPLKDKKIRSEGTKKKHLYGNCAIVFASIVGAHAAVEDVKKQSGGEWDQIESVQWFEGKEPEFLIPSQRTPVESSPSHHPDPEASTPKKPPKAFSGFNPSNPSTPLTQNAKSQDGLRKIPSFASFKGVAGSPNLEEITMIRLKNAEKRRLEEKIRKEEAEQKAT